LQRNPSKFPLLKCTEVVPKYLNKRSRDSNLRASATLFIAPPRLPLDNRQGFVDSLCLNLVALTLIRSHVAADRVFFVGAWHTPLIRFQQMTLAAGAASGVAEISKGSLRTPSGVGTRSCEACCLHPSRLRAVPLEATLYR